jgi:hypothetical protein
MNFVKKTSLFAVALTLGATDARAIKPKIMYKNGEIEASVSGKFDTTTVADIRTSLLNKGVLNDKTLATKTTADVVFDLKTDKTKLRFSPRSKAVWGNDKQIATASTSIKDVDAVSLAHSHKIAPRMIWLREAWVELNLTKMFGMNIPEQTFTIGAFPFSVGRGIALGNAFSVNPASLGFYSDNSVDQYAFGAKYTGKAWKDLVSYDIYGAILENKSTSTSETFAPSQIQAFGKKDDPSRGYGVINWLGAARINITPISSDTTTLKFQPYVVHNNAPEQTVEFVADASSKLTTAGMAIDLSWNKFEFGFEGALNFGKQKVKGWDRNKIQKINREGAAVFVYSDIYDADPATTTVTVANKALYDTSNTSQITAINNVARSTDSNSVLIAGTALYNSSSRFRAPYENKYNGFMVVGDVALWLYNKDFKIAASGGVASGDRNPNVNLADPNEPLIDGTYDGFLGLQEVYGGTQVVSAFVMGGRKLSRPLSAPNSGDQFASVINGFSNLIHGGVSCKYEPKSWSRKFSINPNLLGFWEHAATTKFDIATGLSSSELANKYLGIEFNTILSLNLSEDVIMKASGAVFVPGKHYDDIKGKPFNSAQRKALNAANKTSIPSNLPVIGTDRAYAFTLGLSYIF